MIRKGLNTTDGRVDQHDTGMAAGAQSDTGVGKDSASYMSRGGGPL